MGEARIRSRSRAEVLGLGQRCTYCSDIATTIEHMPPRSMFRRKQRPNGLEFPCCPVCNQGTSAADLVAGYFARIRPNIKPGDWQFEENRERFDLVRRMAPGVMEELFRVGKSSEQWLRGKSGISRPMRVIKADGPVLRAHIHVFACKLGMALFRQHTGEPLPLTGRVFCQWYLNSGLAQKTANAILSKMAITDTLSQGKWNVSDQFTYHFNTDDQTIVASLANFHDGLYVFTIATSQPERFGFFQIRDNPGRPTDIVAAPGDLVAMIPSRIHPRDRQLT